MTRRTSRPPTPEDPIDRAFETFRSIAREIDALDKAQWSEADTRLKVIDRILFDVLGWPRNDASVEEQAGSGYTDYTLRTLQSARIVVEAKRDDASFEFGNRQSAHAYKLNGPVFSSIAKAAINQAIVYSAYKNCELAAATNGGEWVIFRASRLGDGKDTLDGKGFIFASLSAIESNFQLFFDLLSRPAVETLRYRGAFQQAEGSPVRDLSFLRAIRAASSKRLLPRDEFAADFDAIMAAFFERLKGDQDPDMIQKCFVVTQESQLADEKLLRIADGLVEKIGSS